MSGFSTVSLYLWAAGCSHQALQDFLQTFTYSLWGGKALLGPPPDLTCSTCLLFSSFLGSPPLLLYNKETSLLAIRKPVLANLGGPFLDMC